MLSYLLILALLAPALVSATTGIRQCGTDVRIEGCGGTPCYVYHDSNAVMEIDFRSVAATTLRPVVFGTALGMTLEYTLPPPYQNACNYLTRGSCPISHNQAITYRLEYPITPIYPPIPVTVQFSLVNEANQTVICLFIDIIVSRSRTNC